MLVAKDGRRWSWPIASSAAFEVNSNTELIEVIAAAVLAAGGLEVAGMETPAV